MKLTFSIFLIYLISSSYSGYCQTAKEYSDSGIAKYKAGRYQEAISDFTKSLEIYPQNAQVCNLRGTLKFMLQDNRGAISDFNTALEIEPKNAETFYARGIAKKGIKDNLGAITDFTKSIEINHRNAEAYFWRGLTKIQINQKESGCLDFRKAGELGYAKAYEAIKEYCTNLPDKQQFGSEKVSYIEFSTRIKAKYPEYKDVDDLVLAKKMVEKYTEYKDKVIFDQPVVSEGKTLYDHWLVAPSERKLKEIYNYLLAKNPELKDQGYENFADDMKDESKLKQVYDGLSKKYPEWKAIGYDAFKEKMYSGRWNEEQIIQKGNNSNLKLYNNLINTKRITVDELGDFETFNAMLSDQAKAIKLHKKLIKKGFTEDEIGNQADFLANIEQGSATPLPNTSFQIDKIKVGETYIDLPIPNGFVKVDDSMGVLLESAKKMCPKTNTLLAFYLSEKDYANFLSTQNCTFNDEYIIVEVFNDIKDKLIGSKDYRQFINSYKTNYIEEFKQGLNEGGKKASENLSNLDEKLKMDNVNIQPFGICYESKNSISYGILSKYTFTIENESSTDYIVAAISTVTKIDKKPIFLFAYKTYRSNEDLISLKALNSAWIKEVDRKQSPASFIADIDFEYYKEAILAILTLSFIWAIYFATKKIQRKLKSKNVPDQIEIGDKKEYFDFNELLIEDKTSVVSVPIVDEPQKFQEKIQIINPGLCKASRRLRFFNLLIDLVITNMIFAYCAGYILGYFGFKNLILEHQYLFTFSLMFTSYFIQEYFFGITIGKLITGTRVVDSVGNKPPAWQIVIRTASRLIPFEALSFLSSNKRGWHDTISDTFVIKD